MKKHSLLFLLSAIIFTVSLSAEPLTVGADETIHSLLTSQQGKRATVRLTSGGEFTGKVGTVNQKVVQIMEISGKEFYDAVIALDQIEAVVIRARDK